MIISLLALKLVICAPLRDNETGETVIEEDEFSAATVINFNKPREDCGSLPSLINAEYLCSSIQDVYEDKESCDIKCSNSDTVASMHCRCRDEVFPGFSIFIGCRWEIIGDSCPGADFVSTTAATTTTTTQVTTSTTSSTTTPASTTAQQTTATTTQITTTADGTMMPVQADPIQLDPIQLPGGILEGEGHYQTQSDAFLVHIEHLQLQVDQITKKLLMQQDLIHDYEDENNELKNKIDDMEGILAGSNMRDVITGYFMVTSYTLELLTAQDVAHSKLNILRQIPVVSPLLSLDITTLESRFTQSRDENEDGFQPEYAIYFTALLSGFTTDVERLGALEEIFMQVDGYHYDSVEILEHQRKSQEDKELEVLKEKIRLLETQIDANVTSINANLNNIYYETSKIKSIDHNLVVLQEEMAQFHTEEMPALQQSLEDVTDTARRNQFNIESLGDQVYGLDILTSTTGHLTAASAELTQSSSKEQLENYQEFNNMMLMAMQNQMAQMQEQLVRPKTPTKDELLAEVRNELRFEKALMMAQVEEEMKKKENEMLDRISMRLNLPNGRPQLKMTDNDHVIDVILPENDNQIVPPDFMRTENMIKNMALLERRQNARASRLSDNAVKAELDRMFVLRKLGIEGPK